MKGSLLVALLALAPAEVVVNEGESLAQVAQRALETGRTAVNRADARAPGHEKAVAKLKEAEDHFQKARYTEAAQAADEAWKLLATKQSASQTSFTVEVDEKGATKVGSKAGHVRMEKDGITRLLQPGENVRMEKGQPLPPPRPALGPPQPSQPDNKQKLSLKPGKDGLGPITLSWQAVEGAERYEVELVPARGEKQVLTASHTQLKVALPVAGAYRWTVRALTRDTRSEPSPEQGFEVAEEAPATRPINLQVQPTNWK